MPAQVPGALGAAAVFVAALGGSATHVHDAVTRPGPHTTAAAAIGIEAGLTGCLLFVIFNLLSSPARRAGPRASSSPCLPCSSLPARATPAPA